MFEELLKKHPHLTYWDLKQYCEHSDGITFHCYIRSLEEMFEYHGKNYGIKTFEEWKIFVEEVKLREELENERVKKMREEWKQTPFWKKIIKRLRGDYIP